MVLFHHYAYFLLAKTCAKSLVGWPSNVACSKDELSCGHFRTAISIYNSGDSTCARGYFIKNVTHLKLIAVLCSDHDLDYRFWLPLQSNPIITFYAGLQAKSPNSTKWGFTIKI